MLLKAEIWVLDSCPPVYEEISPVGILVVQL